ncbi:MAG: relaxase/mobilization nuclease domain-containing protein [Jaaginema sp. PMC 1079.18]|nr:relaxase/mobilization nuclease domain-containing protein [Jaaginema sp. PMC 1080.18]MEC4852972.1 relaxase/mobilization nuclease domain-containing protein [Jaaginema sp. PMC 1079.18]MEC4867178.1 relaxase/mobilization nuclease domain-containing protein [Jaaginema sp. PMC 1078.18]
MIGHIATRTSFGKLFRYLLHPNKKPRIIGGNCAGDVINELTPEFENCAAQRRSTQKPCKHFMIGFAPADGEVDDRTKAEIATAVVKGLGYTYNQYVVIDHHRDDPGHDWPHDHDHVHIVANAIAIDGTRTSDSWEMLRLQKILRELELAYNLTHIASSQPNSRRSPAHGQIRRYKKEMLDYQAGERDTPPSPIVSDRLQDLIDDASADQPTLTEFVRRLQKQGVSVRSRITNDGTVQGISYSYEGVCFPGYKLGPSSFPKLLQHRSIQYQPKRDLPTLQRANQGKGMELDDPQRQRQGEIKMTRHKSKSLEL